MLEDRSSFVPKSCSRETKNNWANVNDYVIKGKRPLEIKDEEPDHATKNHKKFIGNNDGLELRLGFGDFPMAPQDQEGGHSKKIVTEYDDLELGLGSLHYPMIPPEPSEDQHDSGSDSDSNHDSDMDLDTSSLICDIGRDNTINCLIRCPRSHYGAIALLNQSFRDLIRSGELYKLRLVNGVIEHWVYYSCNLVKWEAFDPITRKWMLLPAMAANPCFRFSDKESMAVGTELLVLGKEITGDVVYKYSLLTNSWSLGNPMNSPRCLFGSANLGQIAIFAGGVARNGEVLDVTESYNSVSGTWETLPSMLKPRKLSSGVFMDGKFYVIGGIGGSDMESLTCGEEYDLETKKWTEIPNMAPGLVGPSMAPPLVTVVNNELYAADCFEMLVKKYDKKKKEWKSIGRLPERAANVDGWGIAFRGCGERIIVIGGPKYGFRHVEIYSWIPSEGPPEWTMIGQKRADNFIYNCAVMSC
ncbi:hypothetical protein L6452_17815 [Arctium lappa]|uniref:Uncharacterized protein n=1 Tax=Arctium lappa TaxID=4217 RepID=A0ACB9C4F9_ARCLA|nr:hypothetical protein L6452_17815 [Arctium lappa]